MRAKPLRQGRAGLPEGQKEGLSAATQETGEGQQGGGRGRLALVGGRVVPAEFRFYSRCDEKRLEGSGQGNDTHDLTYCWRRPFWLWCEQAAGARAGVEAERGVEAPALVLGRADGAASGVGWGH